MAKRGPKTLPRAERFWQRVDRSQDCWVWTASLATQRGGYGHFYDDDQRLRRAHRVAWELTYGHIPAGIAVCHHCDNPPCVRPEHLFLETQTGNLRDMRHKGRGSGGRQSGVDRYNAVLTPEMVREARAARGRGEGTAALARQYGVRPRTLSTAARGDSWARIA